MVKVDWVRNKSMGGRESFPTLTQAVEWATLKEAYGELYVTAISENGQEIPREQWHDLED